MATTVSAAEGSLVIDLAGAAVPGRTARGGRTYTHRSADGVINHSGRSSVVGQVGPGPPGSGKTTLAGQLAPLLQGAGGEPGLVLSTDLIRAELFGDAGVQGPWDEIRALLPQRLPQPVEWIGWWLTTPLQQCKAWALRRDRPVPEAVIEEFHANINHCFFQPHRAEGFAAIVALNPAAGEGTTAADLRTRLEGVTGRIRNACNRQRAVTAQLHRYSRLLDQERLLFLLRLLTSYGGLDESDPGTAAELLQICNPPPQGDLAERAAAYLASWQEVHGGNSDGQRRALAPGPK